MINNKIIGIGIDLVHVDRFRKWNTFTTKKLSKIFSENEIQYSLNCLEMSAQRFASRFAAKEAAYKALSPNIPFLKFCKFVEIKINNKKPTIEIFFDKINNDNNINSFISITHTDLFASAIVVLQQKN